MLFKESNLMKMPKFSPDQLVLVLLAVLVMMVVTAWRFVSFS
jgi:hypothetical protein